MSSSTTSSTAESSSDISTRLRKLMVTGSGLSFAGSGESRSASAPSASAKGQSPFSLVGVKPYCGVTRHSAHTIMAVQGTQPAISSVFHRYDNDLNSGLQPSSPGWSLSSVKYLVRRAGSNATKGRIMKGKPCVGNSCSVAQTTYHGHGAELTLWPGSPQRRNRVPLTRN